MGGLIGSIVSGIVSPVANFFTRKAELSAQSHQLELQMQDAVAKRQVDLISQGKADDAAWELQSLRNSGWRGSFELLVVSVPLVMCFVPSLAPYVQEGFKSISETPQWFQWLVLTIYCANYGIRLWRRNQSDS